MAHGSAIATSLVVLADLNCGIAKRMTRNAKTAINSSAMAGKYTHYRSRLPRKTILSPPFSGAVCYRPGFLLTLSWNSEPSRM